MKLAHLHKRAFPIHVNSTIKDMLYKISENCEQCPKYASTIFRLRTSIHKDNIILNKHMAIVPMLLDHKPILHVLETKTGFQNVIFIEA